MKSHYKSLSSYIRKVDVRNKDGVITKLLGVNLNKELMPSIAKTHGVDLTKYKVLSKNQFACKFMSVGRDEKLPIGFYQEDEKAIVSSAYYVFESIDEELLDSQYLMMWLSRPENDRLLWFKSGADVRGSISWDDFCEIVLPVPSIEKQREIVREYYVVNDRIALNEKLAQKLEDTAQAIYKQWFVDFEFPITKEYAESIGKPELEGKPYKSSGGEMEFCNLLDMEKPVFCKTDFIESYVKLSQGQVINAKTNYLIESEGIPLLRIQDLKSYEEHIFINPSVAKSKIANLEDIIVSRTGNVGLTFRHRTGVVHNNCFKVKSVSEQLTSDFLFWFLKSKRIEKQMINLSSGSVQADLSHQKFNKLPIILPEAKYQKKLSLYLNTIEKNIEAYLNANTQLNQLMELILRRMSKA